MSYYKKIVGERLYLSPTDAGETESYVKWMNDRTVAEYFGQYCKIVRSKDDLKWLYEPPADMYRFAIVLLDGDTLIGSISLHNVDAVNRSAFIGIFIGDADKRGRGYGHEAISLLLEYAFDTINLHSVLLTVQADNAAGIACYKKAGFREVGRLPEMIFKNGRYVDKLYMSILEDDYRGDR